MTFTFITPTRGRDTLERTIRSIQSQSIQDWNAIIIGDALSPEFKLPIEDSRIFFKNLDKKLGHSMEGNQAGLVRNEAIRLSTTEWIGFVDDDDTVTPNYLELLNQHINETTPDVVVFKMISAGGAPLPPGKDLQACQVGISFAVRKSFLEEHDIKFINSGCEDWEFLSTCMSKHGKIYVSDHITYHVRH